MKQHYLVELASMLLWEVQDRGFNIEPVQSIDDFEGRVTALGKPENHPMLSPRWHDFLHSDAFGLILRSDGRDVGGVAARFTDLRDESLADYWARTYRRAYGSGASCPVRSPAPIVRNQMSGKIVYVGEMFIIPDMRGMKHLSALLVRYLQVLSAITWRPDWIYGFVRDADAQRGKANQYGFSIQIPVAQIWAVDRPDRSSGEHLVANDYQHLCHAAECSRDMPEVFVPGYGELQSVQKLKT